MILSEETKNKIKEEFESFKEYMYANTSAEVKKSLGMFFTPAEVSIRMIEKFNTDTLAEKTILDPTCGAGNLLAACLIAGADSDKVFGNEYDLNMIQHCRDRLNRVCDMLGKPHINDWQIHRGNALQKKCLTEFGPEYYAHYKDKYIDDLNYAQGVRSLEEDNKLMEQRNCKQISFFDLFGGTI